MVRLAGAGGGGGMLFAAGEEGRMAEAREVIVGSVCPQLWGMEAAKLAVLLALIGGVSRRVRGRRAPERVAGCMTPCVRRSRGVNHHSWRDAVALVGEGLAVPWQPLPSRPSEPPPLSSTGQDVNGLAGRGRCDRAL